MTVVRHALAVTAAVGIAATAAVLTAGTATAMPTDFRCTSSQVSTTLVAGDPGAGQRYAQVRFTAKPGETCNLTGALPVQLTGAPGVSVLQDDTNAPVVTISDGHSATMLLHWSAIEDPAHQVTPSSVTVTAPASTDPRGNTSDPAITLPWKQGPIDSSAGAHALIVSAVTAA